MYIKIAMACLCVLLIPPMVIEPAFSATVEPTPDTSITTEGTGTVQKTPKAVFKELRYTFASVPEGEKIKHDFMVENQGNAPLVIKNIRPD